MPRPVPSSWWTAAKAATLWGGHGCVLSGTAAARARGLDGFDGADVQIATPLDKSLKTLTVHRYSALPLDPSTIIHTVPVIRAESMAFEICRSVSYRRARKAVGQLVRNGQAEDHTLDGFLSLIGGKGVDGTRWMRAILEERRGVPKQAETDAEVEFARLAAGWGWDPVPQYRLRVDGRVVRRFDFAFLPWKVGIEIDGGIHQDPGVALEDKDKDAIARRAGWTILRFSDRDIWYRPHRVHDAVQEALRNAAPQRSLG